MTYLVGIDEVGRGPIAGPVAVGVFVCTTRFNLYELPDVRDSKKHTEKQREAIYQYLQIKKRSHELNFYVAFTASRHIDKKGITVSIQDALNRALKKLKIQKTSRLFLDGGLRAPSVYKKQKTIIRGDATQRVISFASIIAKVERDRLMTKLAKKYPLYGFERHKGYGTKSHYHILTRHGLTSFHRKSYLTKLK